jgi:hypothetical protein
LPTRDFWRFIVIFNHFHNHLGSAGLARRHLKEKLEELSRTADLQTLAGIEVQLVCKPPSTAASCPACVELNHNLGSGVTINTNPRKRVPVSSMFVLPLKVSVDQPTPLDIISN